MWEKIRKEGKQRIKIGLRITKIKIIMEAITVLIIKRTMEIGNNNKST